MGVLLDIDNEQLTDLYGNDMELAAEVFDASLRQLLNELEHSATYVEQRNVLAIQSMLHKLKPTLGYVCQRALQEQAEQLEWLCQTAPAAEDIWIRFYQLEKELNDLPEWLINQMNRMRNQGGMYQ